MNVNDSCPKCARPMALVVVTLEWWCIECDERISHKANLLRPVPLPPVDPFATAPIEQEPTP